MMVFTKCKLTLCLGALAILASSLRIGVSAAFPGHAVTDETTERSGQQNNSRKPPSPAKPIEERQIRIAADGDPLPPKALARLGTLKQRAADSHLAISTDGKDIITIGPAMTVRVWDPATGDLRFTRQLLAKGSTKIFLSPHGKFVLVDSFQSKLGRRLA